MPKKGNRSKHFRAPTVRGVDTVYENYGVITKYHGGAHRFCDVTAFSENEVVSLKQVRLKGSLTNSKSKQRIVVGYYVLLQYGEIVLIYDQNTCTVIPLDIRRKLDAHSGIKENINKEDVRFGSESDDSSDESDESDEEVSVSKPGADLDCI